MPISFVGATTAGGSNITSIQVAVPSGVQAGDLLLAQVSINSNRTVTAPSGWTLIERRQHDPSSTSYGFSQLYYRIASASEPASYTWNLSGIAYVAAAIAAYRGTHQSQPIEAYSGQNSALSNDATVTFPDVAVGGAGRWALRILGASSNEALSFGASLTQRWTRLQVSVRAAGADQTVSGSSTGTATATFSGIGSTLAAAWWTVVLQPPESPQIHPNPVPFTLAVGSPHVARPVRGSAAPALGLAISTPQIARPALVSAAPSIPFSLPDPAVARPVLVGGAPALVLTVPPPALSAEIIVRPQPVVLALVVSAPHVARPILAEAVQAPDLTVGIPHLARPVLADSAPALTLSVPVPAVVVPVTIRPVTDGLVLTLTVATPRLEEYGVGYGFGEVTLSLSPRWEGVGEGFGEVVLVGTVTLGAAESVGIGDGVWVVPLVSQGLVLTSDTRLEVGDLVWLVAPLAGLQGRTGLCRVLAVDYDPDRGERRYRVQVVELPTVEDMPALNELGRPRVAVDRVTNLARQLRESRRDD